MAINSPHAGVLTLSVRNLRKISKRCYYYRKIVWILAKNPEGVTQNTMPSLQDSNRCRCFFYNSISPARPAGGLSGLINTYFQVSNSSSLLASVLRSLNPDLLARKKSWFLKQLSNVYVQVCRSEQEDLNKMCRS